MVKKGIEFKSKEFIEHDKDTFWYIGIGILSLVGFILAIKYYDYLLGAVIIALSFAVFRLAHLKPSSKNVSVTEKGVTWGDRFFGYHSFRCYWFAQSGDHMMLYLDRLNLSPTLVIPIGSADLGELDASLGRHLPHHNHKNEPFTEKFSRFFRF